MTAGLTVLLVGFAACSSFRNADAGLGLDGSSAQDGASESSAAGCALPQFYSTACMTCVNTHCCSQEQACAADPDCSAWVACFLNCDQTAGCNAVTCHDNCTLAHKPGYYKFNGQMGYGATAAVGSCTTNGCGNCDTSCSTQ